MPRTVLLVEDDTKLREALARVLQRSAYQVEAVATAEEGRKLVLEMPVDVVLTDVGLPGLDGLTFLKGLRETHPHLPVVVMSGTSRLEDAVQAIKLGAADFLEKPVGVPRLLITIENVLRFDHLNQKAMELERKAGASAELIGESLPMKRLCAMLAKVAPTDARVLVLGENGTGKELVAGAIHRGSKRAGGPFIQLNCAAVPADLVESELFGHEKGAFTGAVSARRGRFEEASGGTLFLDEVGDMSLPMQAKLLRVLQEGRLERVGGGRTIEVDVRVIAATNHDPIRMVAEGSFRQDLFYRLNVMTLKVPPLRDRLDDVALLATSFALQIAARMGRRPLELTDGALRALKQHLYPGNVRELRNLIERLTILAESDTIEADDVAAQLLPTPAQQGLYRPGASFRDLMNDAERRIIEAAIEAHEGNKSATARDLGIDRSHFFKKCGQLGIGGPE